MVLSYVHVLPHEDVPVDSLVLGYYPIINQRQLGTDYVMRVSRLVGVKLILEPHSEPSIPGSSSNHFGVVASSYKVPVSRVASDDVESNPHFVLDVCGCETSSPFVILGNPELAVVGLELVCPGSGFGGYGLGGYNFDHCLLRVMGPHLKSVLYKQSIWPQGRLEEKVLTVSFPQPVFGRCHLIVSHCC